jgi:hypothetical protein
MVAIPPSDDVRRLPILMANFEDRAVSIRLARLTSMNHDSVTNLCVHDAPHLRITHSQYPLE